MLVGTKSETSERQTWLHMKQVPSIQLKTPYFLFIFEDRFRKEQLNRVQTKCKCSKAQWQQIDALCMYIQMTNDSDSVQLSIV